MCEAAAAAGDGLVSFDEFRRSQLRVGTVRLAERVPKTDKLLRLEVDLGEPTLRQIIAGIGHRHAPESLVGTQVVVVANLQPAVIRGVESRGMLLAIDAGESLELVRPGVPVPPGSLVR